VSVSTSALPTVPAKDQVRTRIWQETAEPGDAFSTRVARCHGYDVYGALVGQARWVEIVYLLIRGERPSCTEADLLEALAVALANPGPRDPSIHAAMCGGVGGSTAASCLIAALAVGAGGAGGSREVLRCMNDWVAFGTDLPQWRSALQALRPETQRAWRAPEQAPGFDSRVARRTLAVAQTLHALAKFGQPSGALAWLVATADELEAAASGALNMAGVAAAALHELGFSPEEGEMLHLLLRLPGAAAHAMEQAQYGHKAFPFFALDLQVDAGGEA
jgi:citrate synthase